MNTTDNLYSYGIAYGSLPQGKHSFRFEVNDAFFRRFEGSEISEGRVSVRVEAEKADSFMALTFYMAGDVKVACDRCLDEFFAPVEFAGVLTVSFTGDAEEDDFSENEVMNMQPGDTEVDLAQYIYESICLSLPLQRLHPDDERGRSTCNKDMLAKLRELQQEAQRVKNENSPWSKLSKNGAATDKA
ncbi:MAG: DUF177 domain-containing protein [Prevotellaceae bacterium]|jgi:uncharacterized metal-binding protein YceD (DUF177 family)|nr:DUF177 domain-containing protein [Prevotellaceae bacterium]